MRNILIAINLIILLAVIAAGQDSNFNENPKSGEKTAASDEPPIYPAPGKKGDKAKKGEEAEDVLLQSGTVLDAKLLSSLNAKDAQVGDEVALKVTKSVKQDGEVIVPKGTKLIGRVTEVKRKSKDDKSSKLSMVFETLQNKSLSAPINASIVSIASAAGNLQATDMFGSNGSGSSSTSGSTSGGGLGGGLLGGTTSTAGSVLNSTTSTVGGVSDTVGGTVTGATPAVGRTVNGIQLTQSLNVSAEGSSTLSAENKNVKLNKGTQFRIQLNESVQN